MVAATALYYVARSSQTLGCHERLIICATCRKVVATIQCANVALATLGRARVEPRAVLPLAARGS